MAIKHKFTLIEMVVAMAVMVVVAMIIGTASATFYNAYMRSVRTVEHLETCIKIDRIFDSLVRNAVPFKWNDEENASRFVFEGNADSLLFTALRRTYGKDSGGLIFVRLLVEDEELIAEYSASPILPWAEEQDDRGIEREVLAKNISAIQTKPKISAFVNLISISLRACSILLRFHRPIVNFKKLYLLLIAITI